jgi:hypothetical protein
MAAEDELIEERMKERAKAVIERTNKRYGSREKRKQALKQQIEKFPSFSEEQIISMASNIIVAFPRSPLQIGDSWKDKITVGSVSPVEIDSTHTLKGHEEGRVTINVSGKRSFDDKPAVQKTGLIKSTTRLAGSYEATIKVDEKSGWLLSKRADMRFTGETKIAGNKEKPEGMTIAISIESVITVEPME